MKTFDPRSGVYAICLALIFVLLSTLAFAQSASQVSGNITDDAQVDVYAIHLDSAGTVSFEFTAGTFDAVFSLFDSAGNHIITNDDSPSDGVNTIPHITQTLPAGDYQLAVTMCCDFANASDSATTVDVTDGFNPGLYWIGGPGTLADGFTDWGGGCAPDCDGTYTLTFRSLNNTTLTASLALPNISSVSPDSGITGTLVTISGTNFGSAQGTSTVNFGDVIATPTVWSSTSIQVPVPAYFYGGFISVTVGNQTSNQIFFDLPFRCNTDCNAARTSIVVSPQNSAMLIGETVDLSTVDNNGEPVTDATYSIDNTALASIDTTNAVARLTATSAGTVTLTATSGSFNNTSTIQIYAGSALPDGTVKWQVPSTAAGPIGGFIQAQPSAESEVATFALDTANPSNAVIRALSSSGRQIWARSTGVAPYAVTVAPTISGGAVHSTNTSIVNLHPATGTPTWAYRGSLYGKMAVGYDGTIYGVVSFTGSPALYLVGIDPATGKEKLRVTLPHGSFVQQYPGTNVNNNTGGTPTDPIVLSDGSVNLAIWNDNESTTAVSPSLGTSNYSPPGNCPNDTVTDCFTAYDGYHLAVVLEQEINLVNVQPSGATHTSKIWSSEMDYSIIGTHDTYTKVYDDPNTWHYQDVSHPWQTPDTTPSVIGRQNPFIVPNGSGGVVVSAEAYIDWNAQDLWVKNISDPTSGTGVEYTIPMNNINTMVIGENGTAYAAGGVNYGQNAKLVGFDVNSGTPSMSYVSNYGGDYNAYLDITAAGPNGSVYATEGLWQEPRIGFTLDASASRTDNPAPAQRLTYVTSSGISTNSWTGAYLSPSAFPAVAGSDASTQPALLSYSGTKVVRVDSSYANPSPARSEEICNKILDFAPLCSTDQAIVSRRWNKLYNLVALPGGQVALLTSYIFTKLDADHQLGAFVTYMNSGRTFYDGTHSTVGFGYAWNWQPSDGLNVAPHNHDMNRVFRDEPSTQAVAVRHKEPFEAFFRPVEAPDEPVHSVHNGINDDVYLQARIFHESLHAFTGLDDGDLMKAILPPGCQNSGNTYIITEYILKYIFLVPSGDDPNVPYDSCLSGYSIP